ncbi:MAG: hypothetical protein HYR96_12565 [Deltaproteobacteria bacterium]|nr:hypothetical protein [Deltaproteobacteria bacterium]MBI3293370.1 hypothetical protein [Deltaproteobacteria bacterium]
MGDGVRQKRCCEEFKSHGPREISLAVVLNLVGNGEPRVTPMRQERLGKKNPRYAVEARRERD